eukprot:gene28033-34825_t
MPANAIMPIMLVAVYCACSKAWPGITPIMVSGIGAMMMRGVRYEPNCATLACTEFPLCGGKVVPEMDFEHGFHLWRELGKTAAGHYLPFSALTAIHWVHRNFAAVVLLLAGYAAWRAWNLAGMTRLARGIAAVLALQTASGLATIYFSFPGAAGAFADHVKLSG